MVRLLSGLALAAAALAVILFLPLAALRIVALAVAMLAAREFLGIARATGLDPSPLLTCVLVAAVCWVVSTPSLHADLVLMSALAFLLVEVLFRGRSIAAAGSGIAAGLYIGLPLGALVAVHARGGREAVLLLIAIVVVSDTAQYYTGRLFGRHLLALSISPKKTIEGAVGGVVFGTLVMVAGGMGVWPRVFPSVFPAASAATLAAMGLVTVLLGICGDLFESRLKRGAHVKNSSDLIPGHGGVLDRIDALLFATPAFYLFLQRWM